MDYENIFFELYSNRKRPETKMEAVQLESEIQHLWGLARPLLATIDMGEGSREVKIALWKSMLSEAIKAQEKADAMSDAILPARAKQMSAPIAETILEMPGISYILEKSREQYVLRQCAKIRDAIDSLSEDVRQRMPPQVMLERFGQSERHFYSALTEAIALGKVLPTYDLTLREYAKFYTDKLSDFNEKLSEIIQPNFVSRNWSQASRNLIEFICRSWSQSLENVQSEAKRWKNSKKR